MWKTKITLKVIVTIGIAIRIIAFFFTPKTFSSFAPDEATYSALAKWVSADKPAQLFPAYGEKLYLTSRFFLFPSNVMIRFGIDPLQAIRLTSLFFGCASLVLFYFITLIHQEDKRLDLNIPWPIVMINTIYCFLPSHLLWSVVGLRETTIEFLLLIIIWAHIKFYISNYKNFFRYLSIIFLSLICMNATRPQTSYVVIGSLLIYFLLYSTRNRTLVILISIAAVSWISINSIAWNSPLNNKSMQWHWITDSENPADAGSCNIVYQIVAGKDGTFVCDISLTNLSSNTQVHTPNDSPLKDSGPSVKTPLTFIPTIQEAGDIQEKNRQDANTPFPKISCENVWFLDYSMNSDACYLISLPINSLNFLFRPLPIIDERTTFANYASQFENIFWVILVSIALTKLYLGRKFLATQSTVFIWLFLFLYTTGSAMTEGNFGTAFRHKSILLCVLLLLTIRPDETAKSDKLNTTSKTI